MRALENLAVRAHDLAHHLRHGQQGGRVKWGGLLAVDPGELARALRDGWAHDGLAGWVPRIDARSGLIVLEPKPNLVVNTGINLGLDRLFAINGPPTQVQSMGVDNGTTAPTATSVSSTAGGGTDTGSSSRRIVAFDATPTRSNQVVSALGTFSQATVAFAMKRLFLSKAAAGTTDASGDLYAMTGVFTIDLTAFSTWSQTFTATVTGTGS